jgi:hypothetical protein
VLITAGRYVFPVLLLGIAMQALSNCKDTLSYGSAGGCVCALASPFSAASLYVACSLYEP